jgi:hypothetical protein
VVSTQIQAFFRSRLAPEGVAFPEVGRGFNPGKKCRAPIFRNQSTRRSRAQLFALETRLTGDPANPQSLPGQEIASDKQTSQD